LNVTILKHKDTSSIFTSKYVFV